MLYKYDTNIFGVMLFLLENRNGTRCTFFLFGLEFVNLFDTVSIMHMHIFF